MSTYLLLDLRINCLRLASGTMRYWLPSKSNRIVSPGKTAFIKLKILLDRMMLRRTNVCFFFQFDHGFPPWRLPGTKSRWSTFATENNCCSLWLLQLRGEGALSISVWQCVETIEHLCWSGNCAQQCVKLILACHPDLVLGSKTAATSFVPTDAEATTCPLCNDFAEDQMPSHLRQYLTSCIDDSVRKPSSLS